MTERLPDNLKLLYEAFSKEAIDTILPGESFFEGDVEFVCKYAPESTANRFFIVKSMTLVDHYREVCREVAGGTIFELGIAEGGSTALFALLAKPRKIIAVDLEPQPLVALSEFAAAHGLSEVVRPYYGVDQSDHKRLSEIVAAELGDDPLDLVVDDASHFLELTRASFNSLFPRLRPGGIYMIEDWRNDYLFRDSVTRTLRQKVADDPAESAKLREAIAAAQRGERPKEKAPMSQLAIELVLARASVGDAIAEVSVGEYCLTVRRGTAELDPDTFRLADLYTDYFNYLPKDDGAG